MTIKLPIQPRCIRALLRCPSGMSSDNRMLKQNRWNLINQKPFSSQRLKVVNTVSWQSIMARIRKNNIIPI